MQSFGQALNGSFDHSRHAGVESSTCYQVKCVMTHLSDGAGDAPFFAAAARHRLEELLKFSSSIHPRPSD